MSDLSTDQVLDQLRQLIEPKSKKNIVALGLVSDIFIADNKVFFSITVDKDRAEHFEPLRKEAERLVANIPSVGAVTVTLTSDTMQHTDEKTPVPVHRKPSKAPSRQPLRGVKQVIAVASGKGGVGKSTTALNVALALVEAGLRVGVLDADIYGPSLPRLVGIRHQRPEIVAGTTLRPLEKFQLKLMSMGFLVDEKSPMVWRGPMVMSAIKQFLRDVVWDPLDILVVDLPPGTGDAQLSLAQQVKLSGVIIVSTPQELALIDARKGLEMFRKVDVPILGIVENMSYFLAPDTGITYDIFGRGGARDEAGRQQVPFLGEIPFDIDIRRFSDSGTPLLLRAPATVHANAFRHVAKMVLETLDQHRRESSVIDRGVS